MAPLAHRIVIEPTSIRGERGQYYRVYFRDAVLIEETWNPDFEAFRKLVARGFTAPPRSGGSVRALAAHQVQGPGLAGAGSGNGHSEPWSGHGAHSARERGGRGICGPGHGAHSAGNGGFPTPAYAPSALNVLTSRQAIPNWVSAPWFVAAHESGDDTF